jgi:hypothetical protein
MSIVDYKEYLIEKMNNHVDFYNDIIEKIRLYETEVGQEEKLFEFVTHEIPLDCFVKSFTNFELELKKRENA